MHNTPSNIKLYCRQPDTIDRRQEAARSWFLLVRDRMKAATDRAIREPMAATAQDRLLLLDAVLHVNSLTEKWSQETDSQSALIAPPPSLPEGILWTSEEVEAAVQSAVRPHKQFIRTMEIVFGLLLCEIGLVCVLFLLRYVL